MDDAQLDRARQSLVDNVDFREKEKPSENDYSDPSTSIEVAINYTVYAVDDRIDLLKPYLPDAENLKTTELALLTRELNQLKLEVQRKQTLNKRDIDRLIEEIEGSVTDDPEVESLEREALFKLANANPAVVIEDFLRLKLAHRPYAQELFLEAAFAAINSGKVEVFAEDLIYFNEQIPFYKKIMTRVYAAASDEQVVLLSLAYSAAYNAPLERTNKNGQGPWPEIKYKQGSLETRAPKAPITEYVSADRLRQSYMEVAKKSPQFYMRERAWRSTAPGAEEATLVAFEATDPLQCLDYLDDLKFFLERHPQTATAYVHNGVERAKATPLKLFYKYPSYRDYFDRSELDKIFRDAAVKYPKEFLMGLRDSADTLNGHVAQPKNTLLEDFEFRTYVRIACTELLREPVLDVIYAYSSIQSSSMAGLLPSDFEARLIEKAVRESPEEVLTGSSWYLQHLLKDRPDLESIKKQAREVLDYNKKLYEWIQESLLSSIPADAKDKDGDPERHLEEFWQDPALERLRYIDPMWISAKSERERAAYTVMVLRNLYYTNKDVTKETVQAAYADILRYQKTYAEVPLLQDRAVILLSHNEQYASGRDPDRFGRKTLAGELKKRSGTHGSFQQFEGVQTLESLKETKKKFLDAIVQAPSPMTVVFDGHGWGDAIYLSDGKVGNVKGVLPVETENTTKISSAELVEALVARSNLGKDLSKDIFVISACISFNFAQNVQMGLKSKVRGYPLFIAESEYQQYGFSNQLTRYGNYFFDWMLDSPANRGVVGDFWRLDEIPWHNPSVFAPSTGTAPLMQLADAEDLGAAKPDARG